MPKVYPKELGKSDNPLKYGPIQPNPTNDSKADDIPTIDKPITNK